MNQASTFSLMAGLVLGLVVGWRGFVGAFGTTVYLAAFLFIIGAALVGYLLGGSKETRPVMALGTGQRNISAGLLIASTNFSDPQVVLMVLAVSVAGFVVLFLAAGYFGKKAAGESVTQLETS
ncbi:MAG: hypothetical protein R3C44_14530 [Chloroflexota bacterium]